MQLKSTMFLLMVLLIGCDKADEVEEHITNKAIVEAVKAYKVVLGRPVPPVEFETLNQGDKQLHSFSDPLVLEFVDPDCSFVEKHYSSNNMQGLQKKYIDKGVTWLTVVQSNSEAKKVAKMEGAMPHAIVIDEDKELFNAFLAKKVPHMAILSGRLSFRYSGMLDTATTDRADEANVDPFFDKYLTSLIDGDSKANQINNVRGGCEV